MTLVKTDHPRRIDHVIDYFGEPRQDGSSDPSSQHGTAAHPSRFVDDLARS